MPTRDTAWTPSRLWLAGMGRALALLMPPWSKMRLRFGIRMLLCPVDLTRYCEFPPVLDQVPESGVVIDVSSPRLLPWLAARPGRNLVAAGDLSPRAAVEARMYGRMAPLVFDARCLPFADGVADLVTAVSSVEHIPGPGDSEAMAGIGRVLRPGGRAAVSVPVGAADRDHFQDEDPYGIRSRAGEGKVFFGHVYTRDSLHSRLVIPSGLRLDRLLVFERMPPGWYEESYLPRIRKPVSWGTLMTKPIDPLLARRHLRTVTDDRPVSEGVAVLLLSKPRHP
jgi:SAM-dependent methyltransferase